jgi:hypothetical protein
MQIRKNRKTIAPPAAAPKRTVEEGLAWAAGTEQFQHRDPLYHVTESFQQTFDRIGKSHARALVGGFTQEEQQPQENGEETVGERKQPRQDAKAAPESGGKRLRRGNAPETLTRFSDMAFQRGAMSASVLNGTGKMMLVSCLKRSVGESGPKRIQQQEFLDTGSQVRNIPGRSPDQMIFNRTFAKGALGIVVDTLRDARRVVDSMADMARGTGELEADESGTLRTMYPFLDSSRELALEAEYREKLSKCADEREKPVLQNGLAQARALRAKKAQMKNEFISKLRFLSDRATETLSELEAPGALDEISASVWGNREPDLPENPEEGAGDGAPNRPKNRGGAADAAGPGTDAAPAEPGKAE